MASQRPLTRPAPNRYHHGDLRVALIEAAQQLLEERGLDGLSLRAVARAAGVSHAAPYHHFADKRELLSALATRGYESLRVALVDAWRSTRGGPLSQLQALGEAYVRHAERRPNVFRLMLRPESTGLDREDPRLRRAVESAHGELEACIQRCLGRGELDGDVRDLTLTVWSAVHGLAVLVVDGALEDRGDSATIARTVTAHTIAGLRAGLPHDTNSP